MIVCEVFSAFHFFSFPDYSFSLITFSLKFVIMLYLREDRNWKPERLMVLLSDGLFERLVRVVLHHLFIQSESTCLFSDAHVHLRVNKILHHMERIQRRIYQKHFY